MPSNCNDVSCFQQIFEKKLRIYDENFDLFDLFSAKSDTKLFHPDQKMKDRIFSFQLKKKLLLLNFNKQC